MKRKKITGLTLMLATALVSTAVGGAVAMDSVTANAAAKTYLLTDVFGQKDSVIGKNDANVTSFSVSDGGYVYIKRDLAFKWYEAANTPAYLKIGFRLGDENFESVSFAVDSPSAWATKDDKTTNTVTFEKETGGLAVYVNKSTEEGAVNEKAATISGEYVGKDIVISLDETNCDDGEFNVNISLDGAPVTSNGKFVNVGAYYAEYASNTTYPLKISAEMPESEEENSATTSVLLTEINGQKFDNIDANNYVTDTAAPVLVVNEAIDGFQLGTAFSLDYDYIDVLAKNVTITREYYQYNPSHTEVKYNTLSTSVYFYETAYTPENGTPTTVYAQDGKEYVSIKMTLDDGTYTAASDSESEYKKPVYDLSWYANDGAVVTAPNNEGGYIVLYYNQDGPFYKIIQTNSADKKNEKTTNYNETVSTYQDKVDAAAVDVYAGSNSYLHLTSLDKLIGDNNGYRGMKFTISYKTPSSTSASTLSGRSYNSLEIPVSSEGMYEFKVFAVDKAGNAMKLYVDGELQEVDSTNVWEIDEIPSFRFTIANRNLKVNDPTSSSGRKDTQVLGESYKLDDLKVVGATDLQEAYALYKLNQDKFSQLELNTSVLYSVTYEKIASEVANRWSEVTDKDYFAFYLKVYSELVAGDKGAQLAECFEKVGEEGDRIHNDTDKWEVYEWNPSSKSFTAYEKGYYLMLADFWEAEIPTQRAAAYKFISVENKVDEIAGENEWLKNNVVSVVLFSVAGVMLILIIVLLFIKPSDETLEDVDEKAAKAQKASKKEKKEKKD